MRGVLALFVLVLGGSAIAHNVSQDDIELLRGSPGMHLGIYLWLGAKHMLTGYDHLLFLVGILWYLDTARRVLTVVSLFALGHSVTLIVGVLLGLDVNPYLVDAIIGLSVAYKGFDNLGGFHRLFGESPDENLAVFVFGLFHGLGLATKLRDLGLQEQGLLGNLVAFNVGVELGQLAALAVIVPVLGRLAGDRGNARLRVVVNSGLVVAGFALMAYQLALFRTN